MTLELWPAIDIRAGRCVRLLRGDFSAETVYGDPLAQARRFVRAGAERLHVVDLDAARDGGFANRRLVLEIASRCGVVVQAGGGVRSVEDAAALLDQGVSRVVVGTAALDDRAVLCSMVARWPGRVVVGLDHRPARDGSAGRELATHGWTSAVSAGLAETVSGLADLAPAGLVVTDISRDGTGSGPDLDGLMGLLEMTPVPIIASGGVGRVADLEALASLRAGGRALSGVVVGRALVSGALGVREALAACAR